MKERTWEDLSYKEQWGKAVRVREFRVFWPLDMFIWIFSHKSCIIPLYDQGSEKAGFPSSFHIKGKYSGPQRRNFLTAEQHERALSNNHCPLSGQQMVILPFWHLLKLLGVWFVEKLLEVPEKTGIASLTCHYAFISNLEILMDLIAIEHRGKLLCWKCGELLARLRS